MKITNNSVAALALAFSLISIFGNMILLQESEGKITGKAASGYVSICINTPPQLNTFPSNITGEYGTEVYYDVNATEVDSGQSLVYHDNTSLFAISETDGIINFTPTSVNYGNHSVRITVSDNSSCKNSNDSDILSFIIEGLLNEAPEIDAFSPLGNPTITETQERYFNITYRNPNNLSITVNWYVNFSIVKATTDNGSALRSNYTFTGNYSNSGSYPVKVVVSDGNLNSSHTWTLVVVNVNRPPYFKKDFKNQTWAEDTVLYGIDLDDYSYDPDVDDTLSYSINYWTNPHNVYVSVDSGNVVSFSQPSSWTGSENISFKVSDNWQGQNDSNNITLTVYPVEQSNASSAVVSSSSGSRTLPCVEQWWCTYWSGCFRDNHMERQCKDLSACGTEYYKPLEQQSCKYNPSCFNSIKDGDERDTDCGGRCGPCPSCFDGIRNSDETGTDCGGSCPPCPTCFDGIINGGELGIDCGGMCPVQDCCENGYRDGHLKEQGIDCAGRCKSCRAELPAPRTNYLTTLSLAMVPIVLISALCLIFLIRRHLPKKVGHKAVAPYCSKMDRLDMQVSREGSYEAQKKLLRALKEFSSSFFRIEGEFAYEDIEGYIQDSKLSNAIKSIFRDYVGRVVQITYGNYDACKEEIILLANELRLIVSLVRPEKGSLKALAPKDGVTTVQNFYVNLTKAYILLNGAECQKAKVLIDRSRKILEKASKQEREHMHGYLASIGKEFELVQKRHSDKRKIADVTTLAVFLIMVLFAGGLGSLHTTGFAVYSQSGFLSQTSNFTVMPDEQFHYQLLGYDHEETVLYFSDDTKLFNISGDGTIEFTPSNGDIGVYHVTLIVKDQRYKTFAKDIIFNIGDVPAPEQVRQQTSSKIAEYQTPTEPPIVGAETPQSIGSDENESLENLTLDLTTEGHDTAQNAQNLSLGIEDGLPAPADNSEDQLTGMAIAGLMTHSLPSLPMLILMITILFCARTIIRPK